MDPMEVRELRYFIALAEELHFGRAAERLGIAQPPLSRAIQHLERRLGVRLVDRTSRRVQLTLAGEVLRDEGRGALAAMTRAVRCAQRAAEPQPRLVVAMKPGGDGGLLSAIRTAYADHGPPTAVDVHFCWAGEQARLVRDGHADMAFMHSPQWDFAGLDTVDLLVEEQVAVLPRQHHLSGRANIHVRDLHGETMLTWPGTRPGTRPTGGPGGPGEPDGPDGPRGPRVRDAGQLAQLISWGQVVAVLPASVRDHLPRTLAYVPVIDAPATTLRLAWPADSRSSALAGFVHAAIATAADVQGVVSRALLPASELPA